MPTWSTRASATWASRSSPAPWSTAGRTFRALASAPASPSRAADPVDGTSYTFSILCGQRRGPAEPRRVRSRPRCARVPGLANVVNTASIARPEILVTPRPDQAALMGVSTSAISQAVRVATIGDVDQNLPKYNLGDRQVPIRLRLTRDAREDLSVIENLRVPTATGGAVPLSAVADIRFGAGPSQVLRQDRSRIASITAELDGIRIGRGRRAGARNCPRSRTCPKACARCPPGTQEFIQEMISGFAVAFADRHPADVRRAGAAVPQLRLSDHHHGLPAPGHRRRLRGADDRRLQLLDLVPDRGADADGDRGQELHPAGRLHRHRRAGGA